MECSSMFFPIQVKEELLDDGYDTSQTSMSGYYSPAAHYAAQGQPPGLAPPHPGAIKQESVNDPRDSPGAINHRLAQHQHRSDNNDMSSGGGGGGHTLAQLGGPTHHGGHHQQQQQPHHGSPYVTHQQQQQHDHGISSPGGHQHHQHQQHHHQQQQHQQQPHHHQQHQQQHHQQHQQSMSCSTSPKPKKKKKKKPSSQEMELPNVASPMNDGGAGGGGGGGGVLGKKIKQEKITDTFKVRKKVDRFNGMPEEEVVKRTLPDHLATELDIVIIGINPGLFAAFKGHHYAGPGNHFWKCLYLSGLIPDPMTADDDFRLIEFGIGFTNIVSRTTRGSADLARKEIREGAQVLQEKIQKYKPKIAVFNGKGIYEVFSGKKNFDFGKQPEPMEGTNTVVYVMPSSSARCAQLPRAVDKVPFYVALKKLRDHLCGRLPVLRDSEVCFPDVKLKIESKDNSGSGGVKTEPHDAPDDDEEEETRMRLSAGSEGVSGGAVGGGGEHYGALQGQLMHSQRNFHQHPLGRAALAAAAAAGGYMEISLARAGMTSNGARPGSHKAGGGGGGAGGCNDTKKKSSSSKKKRREDSGPDDDEDGRGDLMKRVKTENAYREPQSNCTSPGAHPQRPASVDYHSPGAHLRQPSHPAMQRGGPGGYNNGAHQMSPPGGEHSPLGYSSYHHHPAHIKQEKGEHGGMHGGHLDERLGSPTLLGSYAASVGCLYNAAGGGGYGQPAPPPYFGSPPPPPPPNPYGAYHPHHHLSAHLPPLNHHHSLGHHHHHRGNPLNALASQSAAAELFAAASSAAAAVGLRENGLHHPTARHHLQQSHQHMQQQQQHDYYGVHHSQGVPGGGGGTSGGGPPPPYPSPLPPASSISGAVPCSSSTSSHKDSSPTGTSSGFQQYPSPPAAVSAPPSSTSPGSTYLPHLHHMQSPVGGSGSAHHQYCSPPPPPEGATGGGSSSSANGGNSGSNSSSSNANNGLSSMYEHQSAPPQYANLDSIKVKQERLDTTYDEY